MKITDDHNLLDYLGPELLIKRIDDNLADDLNMSVRFIYEMVTKHSVKTDGELKSFILEGGMSKHRLDILIRNNAIPVSTYDSILELHPELSMRMKRTVDQHYSTQEAKNHFLENCTGLYK